MTHAHTFTLIVPELCDVTARGAAGAPSRLGRLAGRGHLRRIWREDDPHAASLRPWQFALLTALGLQAERACHASAPLTMMGTTREQVSGFWLHAELVHLAAGLDSLSYVPLRSQAAVTEDERGQLQAVIADHLRSYDLTLHAGMAAGWTIRSDRPLGALTVAPEAARRAALHEVMPQGADAPALRRLLTECQMLLHEHPVNVRRANNDLPAINSIWLWGGGEAHILASRLSAGIYGNDPYVRGLCRVHERSCESVPSGALQLAGGAGAGADTVAVIEPVAEPALEEQWLAPLTRALSRGAWARLEVMVEDWALSVTRTSLWRFWRRPRAPAEWIA